MTKLVWLSCLMHKFSRSFLNTKLNQRLKINEQTLDFSVIRSLAIKLCIWNKIQSWVWCCDSMLLAEREINGCDWRRNMVLPLYANCNIYQTPKMHWICKIMALHLLVLDQRIESFLFAIQILSCTMSFDLVLPCVEFINNWQSINFNRYI